ncbi:hypothetical protein OOK58_01960 [Streptomyces sp. NBC_01728]|uniref:hypothetical protein n=1 Tax=unclassified Streptomyces TaxID=2593676 RepID=UPI0022565928|nr:MULTISPECIES: hypothetical protein [unclassified Streptomyces]MCX4461460.1 hypothetical protein [Streptomyces sp. NBC_01719]MCX4490367.1 hypothetical protein [Streptomyces sp. NBC_01728]MCX4597161.1 hypothetical protein [Streptomyces sp. NBC_01549]
MSQTPAAAPLAPMSPNAVMTAFHFVQSVQAGDTDTAGMLAGAEPRLRELLIDVADRIVTPITALPSAAEGDPCTDSFALEALGRIFSTPQGAAELSSGAIRRRLRRAGARHQVRSRNTQDGDR